MNANDLLKTLTSYADSNSTMPVSSRITGTQNLNCDTISSMATENHYAVRGEMLTVAHAYDDFVINEMGKDEIRQQLAMRIAEELLKSKFIEFTQLPQDPFTNKIVVRARAFVVPDKQVQIIRERALKV